MGSGSGLLTSANLASPEGVQFFNDFVALSGGTGAFTFDAFNFAAVSPSEFSSSGVWTVVPEPSTHGLLAGLSAFGALMLARRFRKSSGSPVD